MVRLVSSMHDYLNNGKQKRSSWVVIPTELLHVAAIILILVEESNSTASGITKMFEVLPVSSVGAILLLLVHILDIQTVGKALQKKKWGSGRFTQTNPRLMMKYELLVSVLFLLGSVVQTAAQNIAKQLSQTRPVSDLISLSVSSIFLIACLVNGSMPVTGKTTKHSTTTTALRSAIISCFVVGLVIRWHILLVLVVESGQSETARNVFRSTLYIGEFLVLCGSLVNILRLLYVQKWSQNSDIDRSSRSTTRKGNFFMWFKTSRSENESDSSEYGWRDSSLESDHEYSRSR